MTDMYALSIGQTCMNTFISAMMFLFIGRRVPALSAVTSNMTSSNLLEQKGKGKINIDSTSETMTPKPGPSRKSVRSDQRKDVVPPLQIVIDTSNNTNNISPLKSSSQLVSNSNSSSSSSSSSNSSSNNNNSNNNNKDSDNEDDKIGDEGSASSDRGYIDKWLSCSTTCCAGLKTWHQRTIYSDLLVVGVGFGRIGVHLASLLLLKYTEVSFAEVKQRKPKNSCQYLYTLLLLGSSIAF